MSATSPGGTVWLSGRLNPSHIQKAGQAADEAWHQTVERHNGPSGSASQDDDEDNIFGPSEEPTQCTVSSKRSFHGCLRGRTRLRRLKNTVRGNKRREYKTCATHTHVPHKWLYHSNACAGSVLTPSDCVTNVQKRLGSSRTWTGSGQCRLCGSDTTQEFMHFFGGLKLADADITTEPRGPTETRSRRADLFATAAVHAARLWLCV